MGLFDDLAGQVKGALGGAGGEHGDAIAHMMQSLSGGGLSNLVQQFQNNGLGHLVQSWVGSGQNLPVSADQIQKVLGDTHVRELAAKLGIDPQQAAAKLSAFLPSLVDKMTPAGQLPAS